MLPKSERLKSTHFFNIAVKKGKRLSSGLLTLYCLIKKKDNNNLPKTAFAVGLKVDKRATKRNLIKRRIRSAYILVKEKLINTNKNYFNPYFIFIFFAKQPAKNATFEQIKESMNTILTKLDK